MSTFIPNIYANKNGNGRIIDNSPIKPRYGHSSALGTYNDKAKPIVDTSPSNTKSRNNASSALGTY